MEREPGGRQILDHHDDARAVWPFDTEAALMNFPGLPAPKPRGFAELSSGHTLVLGLGATGLAVARWISMIGGTLRVADTRANPPFASQLAELVPAADFFSGPFHDRLLDSVDLVVVSPGLSLSESVVRTALSKGLPVVGEIELFAWFVRAETASRVVAITGTNGKTTTTALTGHLLNSVGIDAEVAGNIGPVALDALLTRVESGRLPSVWVLELSSYQLESTFSLNPDVAVLLNVSEDHMDRYEGIAEYAEAKRRVFLGTGVQVLNRDDKWSRCMRLPDRRSITFGVGAPTRDEDWGMVPYLGSVALVRGDRRFGTIDELSIKGTHNAQNALASCAASLEIGASLENLSSGMRSFDGLPHRMQLVAERNGVMWFDDSKGTNIGATLACIRGISDLLQRGEIGGSKSRIQLILGGDGKGQDFGALASDVAAHVRRVQLIGRDAPIIEAALEDAGVPLIRCASLVEAVADAELHAIPGDAVLLSPACASFDMFRDYAHRGQVFADAVSALGGVPWRA